MNKMKLCIDNRKKEDTKGKNGKILIIGGSDKYPFAGVSSAISAFSAGADIVTLYSKTSKAHVIGCIEPGIIYRTEINVNEVKEYDVVVIGPGIDEIDDKLIEYASVANKVVLDALSITILDKITTNKKGIIITPHRGEFQKYFNIEPTIDNMQKISEKYNTAVLLKGVEDIVVYKKEKKIIKGGCPYMAKAGTGDALSGLIGKALYYYEPFKAGILASKMFKYAGSKACKDKKYSIGVKDIIKYYKNKRCFSL